MQGTWVGSLGQRKMLWRRKGQPTPVILSGKSQRSLAGYTGWGHKRFGYDLATKQQQLSRKQKRSIGREVEQLGTLAHWHYEWKLLQPLWKHFAVLKKKLNIKLPYDPNNFTSRYILEPSAQAAVCISVQKQHSSQQLNGRNNGVSINTRMDTQLWYTDSGMVFSCNIY